MIEFKIKIKAKKDGKMNDGSIFCYKDDEYTATVLTDEDFEGFDHDEHFWYFVQDAKYNEVSNYNDWHSMDQEFFDEYFEIIGGQKRHMDWYIWFMENSTSFVSLNDEKKTELVDGAVMTELKLASISI